MAGLGRKVFAPGEVLTATNVQNYLMDQAVQVYAGTAARGSAIGSATTEGMVSYLSDVHSLQMATGTATWANVDSLPIVAGTAIRNALYPSPTQGNTVFRTDSGVSESYFGLYNVSTNPGGRTTAGWYEEPIGRILQVVEGIYSGSEVSNSTTTYADTGLTVTITPKYANSRILILVSQPFLKSSSASGNAVNTRLVRGASTIKTLTGMFNTSTTVEFNGPISYTYIDSPGVTSATTYKTQFANAVASAVIIAGRGYNGTITAMEISA
jgi:hypothetical protein